MLHDPLEKAVNDHPGPLEKIDKRECCNIRKGRKCRNKDCRLAMYDCEGKEQLCPWCWEKKDRLPPMEAYDQVQEALIMGE